MNRRIFSLAMLVEFPSITLAQTQVESSVVNMFLQETLDAQGNNISPTKAVTQLLDYLEQHSKVKFNRVVLPWQRALNACENGQGLIFAISKNIDRLQKYDFSLPLRAEAVWGIYLPERVGRIRTVDDLRGKRVSMGRGFSHGMDFENQRSKKIFTIEEDPLSASSRLYKLIYNRADVMLHQTGQQKNHDEAEKFYLTEKIPALADPFLMRQNFKFSDQPLFFDTIHIGCKKGKYQSEMEKINRILGKLDAHPEFKSLLETYR